MKKIELDVNKGVEKVTSSNTGLPVEVIPGFIVALSSNKSIFKVNITTMSPDQTIFTGKVENDYNENLFKIGLEVGDKIQFNKSNIEYISQQQK